MNLLFNSARQLESIAMAPEPNHVDRRNGSATQPRFRLEVPLVVKCAHEGCEESIDLCTLGDRVMQKHHDEKHRLFCKACKKDFENKEGLEEHIKSNHEDGTCSLCNTTFNLTSAIAMHIEDSKKPCWLAPWVLVNALRQVLADPNAVYSPISCSPEEIMYKRLRDFRATLLRAHKEALKKTPDSPVRNGKGQQVSTINGTPEDCPVRDHDEGRLNGDALSCTKLWNCSTCEKSFSSLSKLLQHVEGKMKESSFKSMNKELDEQK